MAYQLNPAAPYVDAIVLNMNYEGGCNWSQNNAFFCDGVCEITRNSETTYGGNLSGGAFYTGGSSQSSTEPGDWTVLQTPTGSVLVLLSGKGLDAEPFTLGASANSF